jgi:hypothetical protein
MYLRICSLDLSCDQYRAPPRMIVAGHFFARMRGLAEQRCIDGFRGANRGCSNFLRRLPDA